MKHKVANDGRASLWRRHGAKTQAAALALLGAVLLAAALGAVGSASADDLLPGPLTPAQGAVHYLLPNLQSGGSIVSVAAENGVTGNPYAAAALGARGAGGQVAAADAAGDPVGLRPPLVGQDVVGATGDWPMAATGGAGADALADSGWRAGAQVATGASGGGGATLRQGLSRINRLAPPDRTAGIDGMGESELALQSMSLDSLSFDIDFHSNVVSDAHGSGQLTPLGVKRYKLAENPDMEFANYSGLFTADGPIGAVARTTWYGGASVVYEAPQPTKYAVMPLVAREVYSHSSLIWIQSFGDPDVEDTIDFWLFDADGSILMNWAVPFYGLEAQLDDLWFERVFYRDLPVNSAGGFLGTFHASSETPFGIMVYGDEPFGVGTYGYSALPKSKADRVQYVPLVRANYYGDTLITVSNLDNRPIDVTITYQCHPAIDACGGELYEQELTIGTRHYANIDLSTRGRGNVESPDLPRGDGANMGFLGTATIRANGPILANAWEQDLVGDYTVGSASYNAFSEADLGTDFIVPHAFMTPDQYPSFVVPMNPGRNRADVKVAVLNDDNQITRVVREIELEYDGGMTFIPVAGDDYANVRLMVQSSEPIALLVIDGPPFRDRTAYRALQMPTGSGDLFPPAPTPTATPSETVETPGTPGTPSPTSTPFEVVGKSYMPLTLKSYP